MHLMMSWVWIMKLEDDSLTCLALHHQYSLSKFDVNFQCSNVLIDNNGLMGISENFFCFDI